MNESIVRALGRFLVKRFGSKKFTATVAAFAILVLQGTGTAEFDGEIIRASSAVLFSYPFVQGVIDFAEKVKGAGQ